MPVHVTLISVGALLLLGLAADAFGRRTRLPRVTLLILAGVAAGPSGLDLVPAGLHASYETLAAIALTMVAFLLGGQLSLGNLRRNGRTILVVSLTVVVLTAAIVAGGLLAIGVPPAMALLLAGISTATAPAATQDVVRQTGARGPFTRNLLGIVAVDDAWGLIFFSLLLAAAQSLNGSAGGEVILYSLREIGGAVLVGAAIGLPAAILTGRLMPGEPAQTEALGVVFLCAGVSLWIGTSYLLAGMVAGAIVVNRARHHSRPFHEIEHIEWPFMVLFFVLAGATLDLGALLGLGTLGMAYVGLRFAGRIIGGWLGCLLAGAPAQHRRWTGLALVPQAGVALGMALVAALHFPQYRETLLAVTIGATVLFEIGGPLLTQLALARTGETAKQN